MSNSKKAALLLCLICLMVFLISVWGSAYFLKSDSHSWAGVATLITALVFGVGSILGFVIGCCNYSSSN
jgi:hypothetical protein